MAQCRPRSLRPPSRSRFQEGSMNDRASAAPPVHFIGFQDYASFDRPDAVATIRPIVSCEPTPTPYHQQQEPPTPTFSKRGSKQFLEQVWDGVREKLRIKRDSSPEKKHQQQYQNQHQHQHQPATVPQHDDRPSRDEVYANYQQLLASGFFSSHAIQSTRQPGPRRPSTSAGLSSPAHPHGFHSSAPTGPQWPLQQAPVTPSRTRPKSPIRSPASASSRGTKRAVEHDERDHDQEDQPKAHKKLRKAASATHDTPIPKFRSSSRLGVSRSFSNASRNVSATQGQGPAAVLREPNRLAKRVLGRLPLHVPDRGSSARRNVSETLGFGKPQPAACHGGAGGVPAASAADRIVRPRRSAAEPLRVRPDANRGIPSVPDIPVKFTYGEDRENDGPWRGLRRDANMSFYRP
ncbi:hypothetical protein ACO1O0_006473 [Amphichorda felina]